MVLLVQLLYWSFDLPPPPPVLLHLPSTDYRYFSATLCSFSARALLKMSWQPSMPQTVSCLCALRCVLSARSEWNTPAQISQTRVLASSSTCGKPITAERAERRLGGAGGTPGTSPRRSWLRWCFTSCKIKGKLILCLFLLTPRKRRGNKTVVVVSIISTGTSACHFIPCHQNPFSL